MSQTSPTSVNIIRINCGGGNYTSAQGIVWSADTGFSADSATYQVSEAIANTDEPKLYQTERYGTPELQYAVSVPNGQYTLNLHFAELYVTQPGGRVFHVDVEGDRVLSNFDTVAEAGGARRAVVRSMPVTVTDSRLDINFIAVTTEHWGRVNAIELIPVGNPAS